MAAFDTSLYYSVGFGVILALVYSWPYITPGGIYTKILLALGKSHKEELHTLVVPLEEAGPGATSASLEQSPSWWTDEEIFRLERRAIFSKVKYIHSTVHLS